MLLEARVIAAELEASLMTLKLKNMHRGWPSKVCWQPPATSWDLVNNTQQMKSRHDPTGKPNHIWAEN